MYRPSTISLKQYKRSKHVNHIHLKKKHDICMYIGHNYTPNATIKESKKKTNRNIFSLNQHKSPHQIHNNGESND